ncbi:MAG: hypothetical protein WBL44_01395 [Nitrososphaeraceae archaeon]
MKSIKIFTVALIIMSALVMTSTALAPSTSLLASSKGLKLFLTVDTNLINDVKIDTYQHRNIVFTHMPLFIQVQMMSHYSIQVV